MKILALQWFGGDPTPLGWACSAAYVVAGIACVVVSKRRGGAPARNPTDSGVWLALGVLLVFLGINKEADLQTILVHFGRDTAHAWGLYRYKYYIGGTFFVAIVLGGTVVLWRTRGALRAFFRAHPVALGGLLFIVLYTIIRFAAIVHLGPAWFVGLEDVPAFVALEMVGSGLIFGAAMTAHRASRRTSGSHAPR